MTRGDGATTDSSPPHQQPAAVVLVHGIGGPVPAATWITPLNATLTALRMPRLDLRADSGGDPGADLHGDVSGDLSGDLSRDLSRDLSGDPCRGQRSRTQQQHDDQPTIINVDYLTALRAATDPGPAEPPITWQRPDPMQQAAAWGRYLARRDYLRALVEGSMKQGSRLPLAEVANPVADALPQGLPIVRRYLTEATARHAVWHSVLEQLPVNGRIVVIAHSLGSVVMLDLLTRLPPTLQVSLLLTVGSPIGIGPFRDRLEGIGRPEG
ncbi:MAG: hypothetical protein ACKOE2_12955, partial [Actinomycetales bacterium]